MNTPETAVVVTPEVEALILAQLGREVRNRQNLTRAIVGVGYADGDKHTVRSPVDGRKLGVVYRSDPDWSWQVVDPHALHAWLVDQPAHTTTSVEVRPDRWAEALAVLAEHAPDLLVDVTRVRDGAVDAVLATCDHQAPPPGVERVKPAGVLTCRPAPDAHDVISAMVAAGVVSWDGRPALTDGTTS